MLSLRNDITGTDLLIQRFYFPYISSVPVEQSYRLARILFDLVLVHLFLPANLEQDKNWTYAGCNTFAAHRLKPEKRPRSFTIVNNAGDRPVLDSDN